MRGGNQTVGRAPNPPTQYTHAMAHEVGFRIATALVLFGAFGVSVAFRHKAEQRGGRLRSNEGGPWIALLRLLSLVVLFPLLGYLVNPDWVAWARVTLPDGVRWTAAAVGLALLPLAYWILASIGINISPSHVTRVGHVLVTVGPYRWVRHPLYTAGALLFLCLTITSALWWMALALVPFAALLARTTKEEANLIATFGDEYRDYMKRTGRFFPQIF
jgi:protein-S-isoprenylcysteine O-methyltransferase Ste14